MDSPLIVGAGPVGLAAALFLARQGTRVRLIDKALERDPHSRALAVNPRTLELLEPTGVTERMLATGLRIKTANFWRRGRILTTLSFQSIHPKYPWMLGLSQAVTEKYLQDAFEKLGGHLERGRAFLQCRPVKDAIEVNLQDVRTHNVETLVCPWIFAADGAHSTVREDRHLRFEGDAFPNEWHLMDIPLSTSLPQDTAHAFFPDEGGFRFIVRVVDERPARPTPLWRIFGDRSDLLEQLPEAQPAGPCEWQTRFHVAHRLIERFSLDGIYFGGDAAHLHSPMGARGMNLGIEDAWVFTQLWQEGRLAVYHEQRQPVDLAVVNRVRSLSKLAMGASATTRCLRRLIVPLASQIPILRHQILAALTGLDHAVSSHP